MTLPRPTRLTGPVVGLLLAALWGLSLAQPPLPAATGLDQSWRIGLTLAAEHGLRFGQDVVFTFGPLGFALQGVPTPVLAVPTALVTALLAAVAAGGVWSVLAGRANVLLKLAVIGSAVFVATNVTLDYAALFGLVALLMRAGRYPAAAPYVGLAAGAVGLIGLLSKYTLGFDALAAASAVWLVAAFRGPRRRRRAALLAASLCAAVVTVGLAVAFRFAPSALGAYVRTAVALSGGYSAGMALVGPTPQIWLALAVAAVFGGLAALAVRERKPELALLACAVMFLAWKHGFVRQDGHVLYYFDAAAIVAPLLAVTLRRTAAVVTGVATTALALGALMWAHTQVSTGIPRFFEPERVEQGAAFLLHPREVETMLAAQSDAALASDDLPRAVRDRIGTATVDVLPWETAIVRAGALHWAPLPVFQSYSAYTPALDALNRDALVAHGADYTLFSYISIDGRYPFGDAPAATAQLLCRYAVAEPNVATAVNNAFGGYVLLRRNAAAHCDAEPAGDASSAGINVPIRVPAAGSRDAFVVASFALRPTFATMLRTALFRAPDTFVSFRYDDGAVTAYRTVAATLPDGMIVSAAPRDTAEAARFFAHLPVRAVREVTLVAPPGAYVLNGVTFTRERRR